MLHHLLGLLRLKVVRGVNLAVRDLQSSDPYVVVEMGNQKLKTRVIRKDTNPEWDEDLTLSVEDASLPVKLEVFDKDTFSTDDTMGHAEFDILPFVDAVRMEFHGISDGTIIRKVVCLAGRTAWPKRAPYIGKMARYSKTLSSGSETLNAARSSFSCSG